MGVLGDLPGPKHERLRKKVVKIFKDSGHLKIVDYLNVTFNLKNNSYKPYRKPDHLPV